MASSSAMHSATLTSMTIATTTMHMHRAAAIRAPCVRSLATIAPSPPAAAAAAAATTPAPKPNAADAKDVSAPAAGGRHTYLRNPRFQAPAVKDPKLNWEAVGEPVCEIMINGYVKQQVLFFSKFAQRTIQHLGMPLEGPITVSPHVRRWTVLTSPFKYKKFQETFERKTFKRRLTLYASSADAVDKCLHYLSEMTPAGVGLRVVRYERETPGVSDRMKKAAEAILGKGGNVELPAHVYMPERDLYEVLAENAKVRLGAAKPKPATEEVEATKGAAEGNSATAAAPDAKPTTSTPEVKA